MELRGDIKRIKPAARYLQSVPSDTHGSTEKENTMSDFRWLIEAPGQRYLAARKLGNHEFHWTQDHDKAIAFRDEAQADMTMMAIRDLSPILFDFERTIGNAKAIEHGWLRAETTPETP